VIRLIIATLAAIAAAIIASLAWQLRQATRDLPGWPEPGERHDYAKLAERLRSDPEYLAEEAEMWPDPDDGIQPADPRLVGLARP
jgi:hypothetical protein